MTPSAGGYASQAPPGPGYYPPPQDRRPARGAEREPYQPPRPPARDDPPPRRESSERRPSLERSGDRDNRRRRNDDEDRRYEASRRPYRYADRAGSDPARPAAARGSCDDSRSCKNICRKIFRESSARNDCEDLSVRNVEALDAVHKVLERPKLKDLKEMSYADFDKMMEIDIQPLEDEISGYSSREAKAFLAYLGENYSTAALMQGEDNDFEMLYELLEAIDSDVITALTRDVDRSSSLLDIAVREGNGTLLEWIHYFLDEGDGKSGNTNCSSNDDKCLFDKYCRIGAGMDQRRRRELPNTSEDFNSLLEHDILDEYGTEEDRDEFDSRTDFVSEYCNDAVAWCVHPGTQNGRYTAGNHPQPDGTNKFHCNGNSGPKECNYLTNANCKPRSNVTLCRSYSEDKRRNWHCWVHGDSAFEELR